MSSGERGRVLNRREWEVFKLAAVQSPARTWTQTQALFCPAHRVQLQTGNASGEHLLMARCAKFTHWLLVSWGLSFLMGQPSPHITVLSQKRRSHPQNTTEPIFTQSCSILIQIFVDQTALYSSHGKYNVCLLYSALHLVMSQTVIMFPAIILGNSQGLDFRYYSFYRCRSLKYYIKINVIQMYPDLPWQYN